MERYGYRKSRLAFNLENWGKGLLQTRPFYIMERKIGDIVIIKQQYTDHEFKIGTSVEITNLWETEKPRGADIINGFSDTFLGYEYEGIEVNAPHESWSFWEQDLQLPYIESLKKL